MADEPTIHELRWLGERNHSDYLDLKSQLAAATQQITSQLRDYVPRELYIAELAALREQIHELREEVVTARRGNRSAMLAAISSIVAAIAVAVVLGVAKGGGR